MLHVVPYDTLGGTEVADSHTDNPPLNIAQVVATPLLDVLGHGDVFRFPVVGFHGAINVVRPLVLQWQQVEGHRLTAVNNALGGVSLLRLGLIQHKLLVAYLKILFHFRLLTASNSYFSAFWQLQRHNFPKSSAL